MSNVSNSSAPVSVNWSSATNLHGDSAGEDINALLSQSSTLDTKQLTQNVTELELNLEQAHANKNASGQTDISDSQYQKLEKDLQSFITVANSAISAGGSSPSGQSAYLSAIDDMVNDMRGEFLENAGSATSGGSGGSFSSFSGGTDGYASPENNGQVNMAALYDIPSASALSEASTASIEPQALSGDSYSTPSTFTLYPSGSMPAVADITQGSTLNDCYFDSVLAQLASTSSGASALAAGVKQTSAEGQVPATFSVKMYAPDGAEVDIAVDDQELVGKSGSADSITGANGQGNWATIYEKAFAKYADMYPDSLMNGSASDGYDLLNAEGTPNAAMMALEGVSSYAEPIAAGDKPLSDLDGLLKEGETVTTISNATPSSSSTTDASGKAVSITGGHAYSVIGVDSANDTITLRNPWGDVDGQSAEITLSESTYASLFGEYEYTDKSSPLTGGSSASTSAPATDGTGSDSGASSTSST